MLNSILAFFIPAQQIGVLFILFALFGFSRTIPLISVTAMLMDAGDDLSKTTRKRSDVVLFSLNSFALKLGTALASGRVSLILTFTNYDANSSIQGPAVASGLIVGRNLLIVVIYGLAILLVSQFSIPKQDVN